MPYLGFNTRLAQACVDQASSLVDAALASEEEDALFALQDTWHACSFVTQVWDITGKTVPLVSNDEGYDYDAIVARIKPQLQKQITEQLEVAVKTGEEDILEARALFARGVRSTAYGQKKGTSRWETTWKSKIDTAERKKKIREEAERKKREAAQKKREKAEFDVFRLHEHGLWATLEQES